MELTEKTLSSETIFDGRILHVRRDTVGELYPSPGYCGEIIRMYLARDLSFGDTDPDEDEFLGLERVPFSQLVEQVLSGEIRDAKTIAAVLKANLLLGL